MSSSVTDLPRANTQALMTGVFRHQPEDFYVVEELPFAPEGDGQHAMLRLRKRGTNTDWLAGQLARIAGVTRSAVGYAGRKDRHAVTEQWFSVDLAGRPMPDWAAQLAELAADQVTVLEVHRHRRKLPTGALSGNQFQLRLRDVVGDRVALEAELQRIARDGVPNYFGEQRFAHEGSNLTRARAMLSGVERVNHRGERGMLLSAARSHLFNEVLAVRVKEGSWWQGEPGDLLIRDGRHRGFPFESLHANVDAQTDAPVHPTGPMWGDGPLPTSGRIAALEQAVADADVDLVAGLAKARLAQDRRALRLLPRQLRWQWEDGDLLLNFGLAAGGYATVVLRELGHWRDASQRDCERHPQK